MGLAEYISSWLSHPPMDNPKVQLYVGASVALVAVGYSIHRYTSHRPNLPPGPRPWPLIGNMPELYSNRKDMYTYLKKLQQKYGNIVTLYFGATPTVFLFTAEAVRDAFIKKGNDFAGRPMSWTGDLVSFGGKDIVFSQPGPIWKLQRKLLLNAFKKYGSGDHIETLIQTSVAKVESLLLEDAGKPFHPERLMTLLIYNILAGMTFGKEFEVNDPWLLDIIKLVDEANDMTGSGLPADFLPILRFLPVHGRMKSLFKSFLSIFYQTINEHKATFDNDNLTDIVYSLMAMQKEAAEEEDAGVFSQLTEDHFVQLLSDLFFAGTDTSRYTLIWLVQYMAGHPDVQRKMQQEIDDAIGKRNIRSSDRENLPYTYAVLHEVMRVRPLAPMFIPHEATCDSSIMGFDIPHKSQVMGNLMSIHYDPKEFEDPARFNPDRFMDGGKFVALPGWLPFSTGRRVCAGETFAKMELHMIVAALFQKFSFVAVEGEKLEYKFQDIALALLPTIYNVIAQPRN